MKNILSKLLLILFNVVLFVGCGGVDSTDRASSFERLSFNKDVLPLIQANCLNCHGRNFYDADPTIGCSGMISFEDIPLGSIHYSGPLTGQPTGCSDRSLYDRLTQLKAWGCYSSNYVVPGDPSKSFLVMKLKGIPCDGENVNPPPANLTDREISLIENWIAQGAQRE